jgi:S1-C subfamily serine protease
MAWRTSRFLVVALGLAALAVPLAVAQEDMNDLEEKAIKEAVRKVAPLVVRIDTQGGSDIVSLGGGPRGPRIVRKPIGSTTGLIVAADGYIITSSYNFINKPTTINVAVPGREKPMPAKIVATDSSRMLTLLKIDATGLPIPEVAPRKEFRVGQWSIALGRTLDGKIGNVPSVTIGIISAVDRIWGKAVQIDSKISPVNYGGPAIDVEGRVQGVLVPASPTGEDSAAGIEWYDSGIGFAIPMEDINLVLPRLKKGESLKRGLLGVTLPSPYNYAAKPVVGVVTPESAAFKAGIKPGDLIIEIEGKPVERVAQIAHLIGPKYEGDTVSVKIMRAGKPILLPNLKLVGSVASFTHAFLGILSLRDDPELGVQARYVYPKSPAEKAGLKEGDRIMKIGVTGRPAMVALNGSKSGRDQLTDLLNPLPPGTQVKLEVIRKGAAKAETLTATLDSLPETKVVLLPEMLPEPASVKKARDPRVTLDAKGKPVKPTIVKKDPKEKLPDTGLLMRFDPTGQNKYWLYVHDDYDPNVAHALVVWFHPPGKFTKDDMEAVQDAFEDYCKDNHVIVVCPTTENKRGWLPGDSSWVVQVIRGVMDRYTIDRQRVVAHGMGNGGQMAFHTGFENREMFHGIGTMGAVLTKPPKENVANQRMSFFIAAGDKDPLVKAVAETRTKLDERKYPVVHREIKNVAAQYFDEKTLKEFIRWLDSLDRL